MKAIIDMMNNWVWGFERFCLHFTRGLSCNLTIIKELVERDKEVRKPVPPSPSKTPSTELARRRAEKKKKDGEEEEESKEEEPQTVRGFLMKMIKRNIRDSLLMMLGMTQVFIPVLSWVIGDPLERNQMLQTIISRMLVVAWMIPLMLMCKINNINSMNYLSDMAYKKTLGRPVQTGVAIFISDLVYSSIFQLFFFGQISLSAMIPVKFLGINVLELVLSAIMYSMFAFEYKWMNMGYGVKKRMDLIDKNPGFHIGFGFPLALAILYFENFWIGIMLYSVFFPILIVSANNAAEPTELRGRSTYIFYPTEKLLDQFFHRIHLWGLGRMMVVVVVLAVLGFLLWLGVLAAVFGVVGQCLSSLPTDTWRDGLWHIWNSLFSGK